MSRLIPLIAVLLGLFFWVKARRGSRAGVKSRQPVLRVPEQSARSIELGFLPPDQLDPAHAAALPAELEEALGAARAGDWAPAAALLGDTGRDWERRSLHTGALGQLATEDDGWLRAWESARPEDPDAAVVRARAAQCVALDERNAARAGRTSRNQFDAYHRALAQSREEIERAARLSPQDPTPYVIELTLADGAGYAHEKTRAVWAELVARAPFHYGAHSVATHYWGPSGHGSDQLARDFAADSADGAPAGSLMSALPLIAWFESRRKPTRRMAVDQALTALVDTALMDVAAAPADHPGLPEVRHLLAYFLHAQGRYDAALEQFRQVDGHVYALPWIADGSADLYVATREDTVDRAEPTPSDPAAGLSTGRSADDG